MDSDRPEGAALYPVVASGHVSAVTIRVMGPLYPRSPLTSRRRPAGSGTVWENLGLFEQTNYLETLKHILIDSRPERSAPAKRDRSHPSG